MKIEVNGENYSKYLYSAVQINMLLHNIKSDTGVYSTHNHILEHQDFKTLVEMGDKIIPYLFHKISHTGADWVYFLLLHKITGVNPVQKIECGKFYHVIMHWLKWYIESDYYKNDDVYHGLIAG